MARSSFPARSTSGRDRGRAGHRRLPTGEVAPGSVGDGRYSPLVTTGDGVVLNASQVANATGKGDNVVALDTKARQVTLKILTGFTLGRPVFYLRTDASVDVVSALEGSNLATNLNAAPGLGSDGPRSARSAIIPIVNGERGRTAGAPVRRPRRGQSAQQSGKVVSGGAGPASPSLGGLRAAGFISNCPTIAIG